MEMIESDTNSDSETIGLPLSTTPRPSAAGLPLPPKVFSCDLCNREFKSKSGLISHMGAKTRCDEKHDLNWLTANLNQQSIQTALNENILLVASFEKLAKTVKDAQSVDNCRKELLKVKSKTKKLIAHLRLISLQSGNINLYNKEIDQLQNQITELTNKYKLLLF